MSDKDLKGNTKRSHSLIDEELAEEYVFVIEEGIEHDFFKINFRMG